MTGVTTPPGNDGGRARGRYAKGERRRAQILATALEVFTEGGFHASSTKEIARRVGVTEPTLFHYFGSKQALLAAVLAARDERAGTGTGTGRLLDAVAANAAEPDLVRLHAVTSAEATDPDHAAHDWFARRYERLRAGLAEELAAAPTAGPAAAPVAGPIAEPAAGRATEQERAAGLGPERLARLLVAAADGLQIQWLLDRESGDPAGIDMADDLRALLDALAGPPSRR
ncbi:Transcriptional regulator, TetR family [Pseudonocardia sp. Ae168_Ps1]|nr:Transcriptional regulator, TetR family [Pseudonocardia sp. Ae150A_Ps1]OLL79073.1 Transcriptional regulator, TetR family [Pseudonocardia sp. Ae168_Ps1]OLL86789.1 Transcriptional regulator, TetR family [Pseudonocardia sp. Ae263_Ps1]OLL93167.1 Transcriptional regulator, TetR family [Pseudonocardia sp. Ae356_Ps1]